VETIWSAVLGLLLGGYFALAGYDYGVAMLVAAIGRDEAECRQVRNAVGPYFFRNEVWLVAFAGVLFGAFPRLEGELLSGMYPLVVALLCGIVTITVGLLLRRYAAGHRARRGWDAALVVAGAVTAVSWGVFLAALLGGLPLRTHGRIDGFGELFTPFTALSGLAVAAIFAAHGASFLALRLDGDPAARAVAYGRRLTVLAGLLVLAAAATGTAAPALRDAVTRPVPAVAGLLVLVAALAAARLLLGRHHRAAFGATMLAAILPVLIVAAARYPYLLVSTVDGRAGLTVTAAAADPGTLRLLGWFAVPLVPALTAVHTFCWWLFRGPARRAREYL
jgi:cytochrome d ubiquinol oxidase subunit II